MSDWSEGYVTDIGYTYGYYSELNPVRLRYALADAGFAAPVVKTACELGFGQGMSINMHAAAGQASWFGTDFNPGQVGFAQHLASGSGAPVHLFDDSFTEFAARDDLPNFDFIGVHGIWSWIDDRNRAAIVDFVRRKLNVGGVLYISYNVLPGWAATVPVRDLMTSYANVMGAAGQGIVSRIDQSLAFIEKLLQTSPAFAAANPSIAKKIEGWKGQNRNYLAHEYFNRDWVPMPFSRMAEWLAPAKLSFACSAHLLDLVDAVNLSQAQQDLLAEIPDMTVRQTARDLMVNQQFRRDYWIKGARRLSPLDHMEALQAQRVVLTTPRQEIPLKLSTSVGDVELQGAIYNPILDVLSDHQPRSLGELEKSLSGAKIAFGYIRQAAVILAGSGHLSPVQDESVIAEVVGRAGKLNETIRTMGRSGDDQKALASSTTGGGIVVDRMSQLFLSALSQGLETPEQWTRHAWGVLNSQGQMLVKDGRQLMTEKENLDQILIDARNTHRKLPVLKALGLI